MENASEENTAELLTLRKVIDIWGITAYYNKDGQHHRIHGPAVIWSGGDKFWYQNGKRHRIGGPAIEFANGTKEWWEDGEYVRGEYS